jgi:D-serine deaminase-like pyridoxal phosphate-dependent protein
VLAEIDVGAGRCGAHPGLEAVALAQDIARSRHLIFGGLQAYNGNAQHLRTLAERRAAIDGVTLACRVTLEELDRVGIVCPVVSGGGTGTFDLEAASGVFTEVQAGSYLFMDGDYGLNLDGAGAPVSTFRNALFVLSTVMSTPRSHVAVLDAGHKAIAVDSGLPRVWQKSGVRYVGASDEHGQLEIAPESNSPVLGEKLRLVPGHCDPTVDRHSWYVGVRGGRVECLWPVSARGAMS